MSRFLAPIHYWLFNKIKYHEDLEAQIVKAFAEKYGSEVLEIQRDSASKYGERTPDEDLEKMIDLQNIHGWLQRKIGEAELRQASIIASLLGVYGNEAFELLEKIHRETGAKYGAIARTAHGDDGVSPEQIYKILNDYILDGMPCDNVRQVVASEEDALKYVQVQCLHMPYWKEVGLDEDAMYRLRAAWIDEFVSGLSPEHSYRFERGEIMGRDGQSHVIYRG